MSLDRERTYHRWHPESDRDFKRVKVTLEPDIFRRLANLADREYSILSEMGARLIELGMQRQCELDRRARAAGREP